MSDPDYHEYLRAAQAHARQTQLPHGHFEHLCGPDCGVEPSDPDLPLFAGRIDWRAFWSRQRTAEDWLIEPLLARGRSHALYAPAKVGKSLLALEVAAAASTGRSVLDHKPAPPLTVLYLDYEMVEDDVYERLSDLGYGPDDDLSHFHYFLSPQLAPLDTVSGGALVVAEAERIGADLVVIDTVARVISGDEREADTFFHLNRYLMSPLKVAHRTVLRIDHAGKDLSRGQRNSSAKNDDVDVVWELTAGDEGTMTVKATYRRLAWVPESIPLTRVEGPLAHKTGTETWPAGTAECAALLDGLGIDLDASVRVAQQALQDTGEGRRQAVVRAALKHRKSGLNRSGYTPGYTPPRIPPDTGADTPPPDQF